MPLTAFYDAVRQNDERGIMLEIDRLTPELVKYIRSRTGLRSEDAREAVHCALIYLTIRIRANMMHPGTGLLKYVHQTAKHNAMKMIKERGRLQSLQDGVGEMAVDYTVLDMLIDQEQQALMESCLRELPAEQQEFLRFVLEKPACGPEALADHFGLSVSNATVRKHRLIKVLRERIRRCYRR